MTHNKICMLGASGVGKTSLVQQFVYSIFMERPLYARGVKISKKTCFMADREMELVIWDLEGENDQDGVRLSYLRGARGFFVVADGTRKETLEKALALRAQALDLTGVIPHAVLINKMDLGPAVSVSDQDLTPLMEQGVKIFKTSAKTGLSVNEAFLFLAGTGSRLS